jgi:Tol biopolymer transport system component
MTWRRLALLLLVVLALVVTNGRAAKGEKKTKPPAPGEGDPAIVYIVGLANFNSELWVMDADGENRTRLLRGTPGVRYEEPSWSHDGREIVFRSFPLRSGVDGVGIYAIGKDGSNLRRLTPVVGGAPACSPAAAPDGHHRIAYLASGSGSNGWPDVYVMDPDGGNVVHLIDTPGEYEYDLSWSPTADRLAVQTIRTEISEKRLVIYELSVVSGTLKASEIQDLTIDGSPLNQMWWGWPEWARTQDAIAVTGRDPDTGEEDIWIVRLADPLHPARIRLAGRNERQPCWSPDDSRILFAGGGIWSMRPDGSDLQNLQGGGKKGNGSEPDWRR